MGGSSQSQSTVSSQTTQQSGFSQNLIDPAAQGSLESGLRRRVGPTIDRINQIAALMGGTADATGGAFQSLLSDFGNLPTSATITDLLQGGTTPESRARLQRHRREIVGTQTRGVRSTLQDLLGGAAGSQAVTAAQTGADFSTAPADASRVVANTVGQIHAGAPSALEIGQNIGIQLGGQRQRNVQQLGVLADLTQRGRNAQAGILGLGADIGARQIGLDQAERIAGARREFGGRSIMHGVQNTVSQNNPSTIDNLGSLVGMLSLLNMSGFSIPGGGN